MTLEELLLDVRDQLLGTAEMIDLFLKHVYECKEHMDKKIAKIQKENKKEGKDLAQLKKMDKKQDKKIEKCDMKMMKKKK